MWENKKVCLSQPQNPVMMDDQGCFKYIIAVTVQQGYFGVQSTDDNRYCYFFYSALDLLAVLFF